MWQMRAAYIQRNNGRYYEKTREMVNISLIYIRRAIIILRMQVCCRSILRCRISALAAIRNCYSPIGHPVADAAIWVA